MAQSRNLKVASTRTRAKRKKLDIGVGGAVHRTCVYKTVAKKMRERLEAVALNQS